MPIKEWAFSGLGFIVGMSFRVGYRYWARGSGPWAVSQIPCYRSNSCCLRSSIIPIDTFITGSLCNDRNALAVDLRSINFKLFGQSVFLSVTLGS